MSDQQSGHIPVLLKETLEFLNITPGKWIVDVTFGRGGHTTAMLEQGAYVVAIDQDEEAIAYARQAFALEIATGRLKVAESNFEKLSEVIASLGLEGQISGVLADLGVSSNQLDTGDRGFSFQLDAPLDMRMDKDLGVTAKDLVNALGKKELYGLLTEYAQEKHARVIVDRIIESRKRKPIETTKELSTLIEKVVRRERGIHPATKTFMALRMLVNDEIGALERMLPQAFEVLSVGGRMVTISFHEGEDRIIKHFVKNLEEQGKATLLSKKPVMASEDEMRANPRSRSAKVRAIEKKESL